MPDFFRLLDCPCRENPSLAATFPAIASMEGLIWQTARATQRPPPVCFDSELLPGAGQIPRR